MTLKENTHLETNTIVLADNLGYLCTMPDNSVDAIVTDSPYGLGKEPDAIKMLQAWITTGYLEVPGKGFMGKKWDSFVPQPLFWKECFRVLKPGGHCLSFFGTRTYDWGVMAMRLGGFEVRDCISWIYGSGFPKSLDISKALDKSAGVESLRGPEKVAPDGVPMGKRTPNSQADYHPSHNVMSGATKHNIYESVGNTDAAKQWQGWGTALKPAQELIAVCRKPLIGTVAENILAYGTGGVNIDGCRVATEEVLHSGSGNIGYKDSTRIHRYTASEHENATEYNQNIAGRFPANIIFDEEAAEHLDQMTGILKSGAMTKPYVYTNSGTSLGAPSGSTKSLHEANIGGASRFFYCAKASKSERAGRKHPTIKPLALMRYLVKLVCPVGGVCLDPHGGSGTTGAACFLEDIQFIIIDNDPVSFAEAEDFVYGKIMGL